MLNDMSEYSDQDTAAQKLSALPLDLIAKHSKNGPRYTSYPTAKQFHPSFNEDHYRRMVTATNEDLIPRDLSLYLHIPFCNTICFYCACNRIITANRAHASVYLDYLIKEISMQAELFDRDRTVRQMHWGGGTPTYLNAQQIRMLHKAISRYFNLASTSESDYSIEIDPRHVELDTVSTLAELGFNRMSLGVQDFARSVQTAVNRLQSFDLTQSVLDKARAEGFQSINLDLIYGLPLQTLASFDETLDQVIELNPDRLAIYHYAHMPHLFKSQKQINEDDLPDSETKLQILNLAIRKLQEAGYVYIGMDHFAKQDDELYQAQQNGTLHRSFQGYTTHGDCDLIGLGASSISQIGQSYSQNLVALADYQARLDQDQLPVKHGYKLDKDDCLRRKVISDLVCHFQLDLSSIEYDFDIDFTEYFYNEMLELEILEQDGLVNIDSDKVIVTEHGRLLIRNICMVFDKYLNGTQLESTFSKVV